MGEIMTAILTSIAVRIAEHAATAVVDKVSSKIDDAINGDSSTGEDTVEAIDEKNYLLAKDNILTQLILKIVSDSKAYEGQLNVTDSDIVSTIGRRYRCTELTRRVINAYKSRQISYEGQAGSYEINKLSFTNTFAESMYSYAKGVYDRHFSDIRNSLPEQFLQVDLPKRVSHFIVEVFRTRGVRPYNKIFSVDNTEGHVIWSPNNVKDIFGNELVAGRLAIIKVANGKSGTFTYWLATPKIGSQADFLMGETGRWITNNVIGYVEQFFVNQDELMKYPINYSDIGEYLKKLY